MSPQPNIKSRLFPPSPAVATQKPVTTINNTPEIPTNQTLDLTSVRIFLSNLGLISQPPIALPPRPPSPVLWKHKNTSHNNPATPLVPTPVPTASPAASTSSILPPSTISASIWSISHSNFRLVDMPNAGAFDFKFGLLDELRERECFEIAVLYIPPKFPTANPDLIFDISEGSPKFEEFVRGIGWKVRLLEHTGYSGQVGSNLPADSTECSIYYANNTVEVMYRVSSYLARYRKMALSLASLTRESENFERMSSRAQLQLITNIPLENSQHQLDSKSASSLFTSPATSPEQSKEAAELKSKRGSFKKSMSVSGGMGITAIQNREVLSSGSSNRSSSQYRRTSFGDEENNINTLASRKKLLTAPKVLILWSDGIRSANNLHANAPTSSTTAKATSNSYSNSNSLPQFIGSRALISIIIFPLNNGLFHIRVVKKPSVQLGPLLDDIVVSFPLLPQLVRLTAINACRALNDFDSPRPGVVRKNIIEEFTKPSKENSFYNFYSPHFSSTTKL